MLRKRTSKGWILITHPDHAHLAGEFASHWGNETFAPPLPRKDVLEGIFHHDDGWKERDKSPQITRDGLPSAFSTELVGKYSAFEEIDLADYLDVRRRALELISRQNPFAAVMISMHTHNLLSDRADRSTIRQEELPLLDAFLADQLAAQKSLRMQLEKGGAYPVEDISDTAFLEHFRLLQACDSLSLLSCVDYDGPADLQHDLRTRQDRRLPITYTRRAPSVYELSPFPFNSPTQKFTVPYRHVPQHVFSSATELTEMYLSTPSERVELTFVSP